jgi:hypothetical protein
VERVLPDIDADHSDRGVGLLRHGVLLVFGAPGQLRLLAGQEHGRTIRLADISQRSMLDWRHRRKGWHEHQVFRGLVATRQRNSSPAFPELKKRKLRDGCGLTICQ